MTILFDLLSSQPTGNSKFHGGGEYIKTVFRNLVNIIQTNEIIVFYDNSRFLDDWVKTIIIENNIREYNVDSLSKISFIFESEKIDIFYSGLAYSSLNNIVPKNVKKIGTVHGLRGYEKPADDYEYMYLSGMRAVKRRIFFRIQDYLKDRIACAYKKVIDSYDEFVCVSEHTKYALVNVCNKKSSEINVFYTPAKYLEDVSIGGQKIVGKYILLIGGNRWEKNVYRAILAINNLKDRGHIQDYKVVIVGELPIKIKKKIAGRKYYNLFGYLEPIELENLYKYCDIFVYPSLNEGFGMPPLEAMNYGKTCIVSCVCSLPEICGDAVYYCNPYDVGEMENRILRASEEKISVSLVKKQLEKVQKKQESDLQELCKYLLGGK